MTVDARSMKVLLQFSRDKRPEVRTNLSKHSVSLPADNNHYLTRVVLPQKRVFYMQSAFVTVITILFFCKKS